ncbi:MAG: ribosome biogenesis GTP-binding protein YihA/YsxC [Rickettsiaceae bacterium]|nr:ribosome biogenesis GTP-binding protein YihA/YsxC [Rickettsiaceae bacterium]
MAQLTTKIFKQEAKFIAGVARIDQFPRLFLPQIAFFGKSNVGKSSLINTICNRKSLARVSHTPGRTQQINFFSIADRILIADLPGYGFAKVPKSQRSDWVKLITHYLQNEEKLKLVNLLIDARRGIKPNDIEIMELLKSCGKEFQIILTKADKVNVNDKFLTELKDLLATLGCLCNVISTSSKSGLGEKELQLSIMQFIK